MEAESTNDTLAQEPKLLNEFVDACEELNGDESDSDEEIYYDISADFDSFMDRLIEKRRNEIAVELRRLNYTDQSSNRSRLENWFQSNVQSERVFRSSTIQSEIAQLSSIGSVSRVLSTSRAQIESVLQNMVRREPQTEQRNRPNQIQAPSEPPRVSNELALAINQISREQVIGEISELVHRQLVSNSLRSEFRTVLEDRVMDRLNRIGSDGAQTSEYIRNLPNNDGILRNDFSNLGLNDDAESVSSMDARIRGFGNSREIKNLKKEISELKNLIKLSFELQMDMQGSLKQEISALINGTFKETGSMNLVKTDKKMNSGICIICTEAESNTVFYQCGHLCACYQCSMNLRLKNHNCPVCRAPIKDIIRTYKCAHE
ncbi:Neuralized 1A [Brachionus plicatilis]|uniref:Neuralized 1A n=1 Tax=Brachionus plicatilis TaxID=10195 RepID=A0A3M7P899_BRAPC|nr:Neuralized 1A [Brachionus plicatilis]